MSIYDPSKYDPIARRERYLKKHEERKAARRAYYQENREREIAAQIKRVDKNRNQHNARARQLYAIKKKKTA